MGDLVSWLMNINSLGDLVSVCRVELDPSDSNGGKKTQKRTKK